MFHWLWISGAHWVSLIFQAFFVCWFCIFNYLTWHIQCVFFSPWLPLVIYAQWFSQKPPSVTFFIKYDCFTFIPLEYKWSDENPKGCDLWHIGLFHDLTSTPLFNYLLMCPILEHVHAKWMPQGSVVLPWRRKNILHTIKSSILLANVYYCLHILLKVSSQCSVNSLPDQITGHILNLAGMWSTQSGSLRVSFLL